MCEAELVRESIKKWESIQEGSGVDKGAENCALCSVYFVEKRCGGCPVAVRTGQGSCRGTPYEKWRNHQHAAHSCTNSKTVKCSTCKAIASEIIDALHSLKTKLQEREVIMIVQYIRKPSNRKPYATLVAYKEGDDIRFGYSKYAKKLEIGITPFVKKLGRSFAYENSRKDIVVFSPDNELRKTYPRKNDPDGSFLIIPHDIEKFARHFLDRIFAYFGQRPVNLVDSVESEGGS